MKKIAVCGCCVSRDTIAFSADNDIKTVCFIHFNSPLSLACDNVLEELKITQDSHINCTPFLQRVFYADWVKNSFPLLKNADAEWCVIDIGHIRYDLGEITRISDKAKTYITYSREATENINKVLIPALGGDYSIKMKSIYDFTDTELDSLLGRYCEKLLEIFPEEKIILQEVSLCECYKDVCGDINVFEQGFCRTNTFVEKCHKIIRSKIPGCKVIPFPDYVLCDENHVWGRYCLHYEHMYYDYAYECLKKIVEQNITNEQIGTILNKYNEMFTDNYRKSVANDYKKLKLLDNINNMIAPVVASEKTIEKGGISGSSCYNKSKHELVVKGWYLPVDAYDKIVIEVDGQYIGEAKTGIERPDVEQNYRFYKNARNSGFELSVVAPSITEVKNVTIKAIKSEKMVECRTYRINNI